MVPALERGVAAAVTTAAAEKINLAPLVGASLAVMGSDAGRMRGPRSCPLANLKESQDVDEIARFLAEAGGLAPHPAWATDDRGATPGICQVFLHG
jgi:hypothetical protein